MDILVFFIDDTIIEYKNVCSFEFDEGEIHLERIVTDAYNCTFLEKHCHFISDVTGIEVLKIYDYRFV